MPAPPRTGLLRLVPGFCLMLLALPVAGGLWGTVGPALTPGVMGMLTQWPGLSGAVRLSLVTGIGSTIIALAIALLVLAGLRGTRTYRVILRILSPLLAVPHATAALGLAFLIAPSGWITRALSPWATGWTAPPDVLTLNDPAGLALMLGLVIKEIPFLLLMSLAALPQTDAARRITLAETLGYSRSMGFALTVLPALYRQLRLPVYAVLTYAMTVVDMAQVLGPTLPHTLSVQITLWMTGPDLLQRPLAAAAALLQCGLVLAALTLWRGAEVLAGKGLIWLAAGGHRAAWADRLIPPAAAALAGMATALLILSLAGLALWSVTGQWQFPAALPQTLTLRHWSQAGPGLWTATAETAVLGLAVALSTIVLTLAWLEAGHRFAALQGRGTFLLWVPLLVPQIAFLPGLQALALTTGTLGWTAAFAAHLTFALPYCFLSLAPAFRAFDPRIARLGATLGASADRIFWTLRLPMLLRPVLTAAALAFAVSVGQYLPTLLMGGGRIQTLTTEAVALSSGGNRRLIGTYGLLQMILPALAFAAATLLPALIFARRRGMAT